MNKLITKIVGAALGLTMAVGVGVAVGASKGEAVPVHATSTGSILISSVPESYQEDGTTHVDNGTQVGTITLNSSLGLTLSVNTDGNNGKFYNTGAQWRVYQSNNPSVVLSISSNYVLDSVAFTYSVSNSGVLTYGGSNKTSDTSIDLGGVSNSATFGVGNTSTKTNGQVQFTAVTVSYSASSSDPSVTISSSPAYLVDGGSSGTLTATIANDDSYTVTWSASPSTGVTFSPAISTSGGNVSVSFDGVTTGTTPVVITATIDDDNNTASDPKNIYALAHAGTSSDPFTATEAMVFSHTDYAAQSGGDWYVEGYVVGTYNTDRGYYVDEDSTATSSPYKFEVFNSSGVTNSTGKEIIVGTSYIVAHGSMTYYANGSQCEITGAVITSVDNGSVPSVVINEGDQSIFLGDPLTFTATTENPDDAVVTWSSSDTDVATIDSSSGVVTTVGGGTTTITATITVESQDYTASVTLEVTAPLLKAGDSVIFYYDTNYLTDINTSGSTHYGNRTTTKSEALVYTVEAGSAENSFAFSNSGNYLTWASGNSLDYANSVSASSSWSITGDSLTNCTITNVGTSSRIMKYNSGSPRFACYTSGQNAVSIEKVVITDPTTLTLDTKTLTLEAEEVASSALTFTTDSPSASFVWYSEDTNKATVSNGVVTAGTQTDVSVKIYVYFDTDGSGDFNASKDLNDYCTVTITAPVIDYSSITYGGTGTKITSNNKSTLLADGKKIIMTYNDTEVAGAYGNYIDATTSSVTFDTANNKVTIGDGTTQINTLTILELEVSTNGFYLKTKDGKYLSNTSSSSSAGNFSKTDTAETEWSVSESGIYDYDNQANATIMVNTSTTPDRFKPYKSSFAGAAVVVYSFEEYVDEAETYADSFLESGLCGSNDNTKASSTIWGQQRTAYLALSTGAQNVLKTATANKDSTDSIQKCLAKYDRVIYLHYGSEPLAYPDFMNRVSGGYVTPLANSKIVEFNSSETTSIIIVVISMISLTAIGGFFFIKKRKEQ